MPLFFTLPNAHNIQTYHPGERGIGYRDKGEKDAEGKEVKTSEGGIFTFERD